MEINKDKVIDELKEAAQLYQEYFLNKSFIFIDEIYECTEVFCTKSDFAHLTGVYTKLKDKDFYDLCIKRKIVATQISFNDRFTYKSHKKKMKSFKNLNQLVDGTHNNTRGLYVVSRQKGHFPFAVANLDTTLCFRFNDNKLHPKSLRNEKIRDCQSNRRIILIAEHNNIHGKYKKINFGNKNLLSLLDEDIQEKFDSDLLKIIQKQI